MTEAVSLALNAWIDSVSTPRSRSLLTVQSREALAAYDAVSGLLTPSGMVAAGTQDVARQQAELHEAQKTYGNKSSEAVEKMLKYPATGLMHISDMARIRSGWNPVSLDNTGANSKKYEDYNDRLLQMPLLTLDYAERQTIHRESSNWNELIDNIANTFTGIAEGDKSKIRDSLKNLASAASSKVSTDERTDLFCQGALNTGNNIYQLFLYNTKVTFHYEQGKGFESMQSKFEVLKMRLTLKYQLWIREYVEKLIDETSSSLDDWLNGNKTQVDSKVKVVAFA